MIRRVSPPVIGVASSRKVVANLLIYDFNYLHARRYWTLVPASASGRPFQNNERQQMTGTRRLLRPKRPFTYKIDRPALSSFQY
jgi:hypothetical protein